MRSNVAVMIACYPNNVFRIPALKTNMGYLAELSNAIYVISSGDFKGVIEEALADEVQYELHTDLEDSCDWDSDKTHVFIVYRDEDTLFCHGKWADLLHRPAFPAYEGYILTNDSFVLLDDLSEFEQLYRSGDYDLVGFIDSHQRRYHYPSWLRYYSHAGVYRWLKHFDAVRHRCRGVWGLIRLSEIPAASLFKNKTCLYKVPAHFRQNMHYVEPMCRQFLVDRGYPVIKLKQLYSYAGGIPLDFDPEVYRSLHPDLKNHPNVGRHFREHGRQERRRYKPNQKVCCAEYIRKLIRDRVPAMRSLVE